MNFLGQPMGRSLHGKLRGVQEGWKDSGDDASLVEEVSVLAKQFPPVLDPPSPCG